MLSAPRVLLAVFLAFLLSVNASAANSTLQLKAGERVISIHPFGKNSSDQEEHGVHFIILTPEGEIQLSALGKISADGPGFGLTNPGIELRGFPRLVDSDPNKRMTLGKINLRQTEVVLSARIFGDIGLSRSEGGVQLTTIDQNEVVQLAAVGKVDAEGDHMGNPRQGEIRGFPRLVDADPSARRVIGKIQLAPGESILSAQPFGTMGEPRDAGGIRLVTRKDGRIYVADVGKISGEPFNPSSSEIRGFVRVSETKPNVRFDAGPLALLPGEKILSAEVVGNIGDHWHENGVRVAIYDDHGEVRSAFLGKIEPEESRGRLKASNPDERTPLFKLEAGSDSLSCEISLKLRAIPDTQRELR
jgi:hypothetical protein